MPRRTISQFRADRAEGQQRLLDSADLVLKRFLSLDSQTYRDTTDEGGLDDRTKELLGLVASATLRCDDCIDYHLEQCVKLGWSDREIMEALNVALIVGGSIGIPHLRRARQSLDELLAERDDGSA